MSGDIKTAVIIVLYYPDVAMLTDTIAAVQSAAAQVILADNTPSPDYNENLQLPGCVRLNMGGNAGIATAQAEAITHAAKLGATHILLLDQDSLVYPGFLEKMEREYVRLEATGEKIFALAPTIINTRSGEAGKALLEKDISNADGFIGRRQLISSGSFLSMTAVHEVGLPDRRLFIDYVDFEWCWRAAGFGFKCFYTSRVELEHAVGAGDVVVGKHRWVISAPERYFYQFRNYFWLRRRDYVPVSWKRRTFLRMVFYFVCLPWGRPRAACYWRNMWLGACAGLKQSG